jgi:uncharacterized lipoprotein YddW (UPF0748 family)
MEPTRRSRWRMWLAVLLALAIPTFSARASMPRASGDDFERLAERMGRVEAWYAGRRVPEPAPLPPTTVVEEAPAPTLSVPTGSLTPTVYLPLVRTSQHPITECRGLWVTRYDWTSLGQAPAPAVIDGMVAKASRAGFNTLFFQVRAAGDAYYTPGLEPWAARLTTGPVSETLGVDPGWDPLAHMLATAHGAGLEVHAYVNVYTAWLAPPTSTYGLLWPPATEPPSMFDRFTYGPAYADHPGAHGMGYAWRHYDPSGPMPLAWRHYLWASPGVDEVQDHLAAVVADVTARYPVDGIHLDRVRYAGPDYSYDPASNLAAGDAKTPARDRWQRGRVTSLVRRITEAGRAQGLTTSAAVWPYASNPWGWNVSTGYDDYYQDAKGWVREGAVDVIVPMMYGGEVDDIARWQVVLQGFAADPGLAHVYPGVGGYYTDFAEVADRIAMARTAGAPGHVVFSFSGVDQFDYWDDFAEGPYR